MTEAVKEFFAACAARAPEAVLLRFDQGFFQQLTGSSVMLVVGRSQLGGLDALYESDLLRNSAIDAESHLEIDQSDSKAGHLASSGCLPIDSTHTTTYDNVDKVRIRTFEALSTT